MDHILQGHWSAHHGVFLGKSPTASSFRAEMLGLCVLHLLAKVGAALENSLRKKIQKHFLHSTYNAVDMVCCMNIHHERF
jgi:hypothetical protein